MNHWLSSTLQTVREKSLDALEFVKKDLVDFTATVKHDTETYLNKITHQQPTSIPEDSINVVPTRSFDRIQNERTRLQNDESTYLIDPIPTEIYETWREKNEFNVENCKGEIAQLLIDAPHVRANYAKLVPASTTHSDFWSRYYFRMYQLDEDETRRVNLLKRAEEICNEHNSNDWDEPDEEWPQEPSTTKQELPVQSEETVSKRKESDSASGDSWEREFDENDLNTSKIESENSASTLTITKPTTTTTNNEIDDEWESWS